MEDYKSIRFKIWRNDKSLDAKAAAILNLNDIYKKWHPDQPEPEAEVQHYYQNYCESYTFTIHTRYYKTDVKEILTVNCETKEFAHYVAKHIMYRRHKKIERFRVMSINEYRIFK